MRALLTTLVVVLVALFGCSQSSSSPTSISSNPSGGPSITLSGGEMPFKGRLEGDITMTPLPPSSAFVLIEGTGNATHLGRFTVEMPHIVTFATMTASGSIEFTAANGNTLTATFAGQASPTGTPGVLSIVETATIMGGTGRFAGATGSFTLKRLSNAGLGVTTGSFEGTISSPGTSKH